MTGVPRKWAYIALPIALLAGALAACTSGNVLLGTDSYPDAAPAADAEVPFDDAAPDDASPDDASPDDASPDDASPDDAALDAGGADGAGD
jgi:hypothetical protein